MPADPATPRARAPGARAPQLALAAALLAMLAAPGPARAVSDPREMLQNPAEEARAEAIGRELRCLVCQNEDIEDSGADLARDLRRAVRRQVAAGRTNREIIAWMTARYGEFVLLAPPFSAATAALWLMPLLALGAGALLARRALGGAAAPAPAPLDAAERARLSALEDGGERGAP